MRTGACDRCGTEFVDTTTRGHRRFCSDTCRKRACAEAHRAICASCGEALTVGSAWRAAEVCGACSLAASKARTELIVQLWNDGLSRGEIAERLGDTPASITARISEQRRLGVQLPYRRADNLSNPTLWQPGESGREAA
jgi:DNA-binding CsgD family transcriptional regulator